MRITYDSEADALAVILREGVHAYNSVDVEEGVTVDLDAEGHVVGLEILQASARLGPDPLEHVAIERYHAASREQMPPKPAKM